MTEKAVLVVSGAIALLFCVILYAVPPSWTKLGRFGKSGLLNGLLKMSPIWLFIVPMAADALSGIGQVVRIPLLGKSIILSLPFNWLLLYFSAVAFGMGSLVYSLGCPPIIRYEGYSDFVAQSGTARPLLRAYADCFPDARDLTEAATSYCVTFLEKYGNTQSLARYQGSVDSGGWRAAIRIYMYDNPPLGQEAHSADLRLVYLRLYIRVCATLRTMVGQGRNSGPRRGIPHFPIRSYMHSILDAFSNLHRRVLYLHMRPYICSILYTFGVNSDRLADIFAEVQEAIDQSRPWLRRTCWFFMVYGIILVLAVFVQNLRHVLIYLLEA